MSTPTVSKLLLTSFVTMALACFPNPAFGQHHGRGSRGGGGSHRSASRGGGRLHSGGGGFHLGRGLFGGKGFGRGLSASPRQRNGGSSRRFGRSGSRPNSNPVYVGGRGGRSNRPPDTGSALRNWSRQAQSSWANTPRSTSSFNSNRPPAARSASGSWSRQAQSSWASLSRSTLSFNPNRRLSNSRNSRYRNSAFDHSSFSNSRIGSSVPMFGSSRFAGAHHFDSGAASFNRESSFGGGDISFIPDLLGLALNLGGFGLRGLASLGSSLASFSSDANLESRQRVPGSAFYSTQNLTCMH